MLMRNYVTEECKNVIHSLDFVECIFSLLFIIMYLIFMSSVFDVFR